jgi:hypothetical protein
MLLTLFPGLFSTIQVVNNAMVVGKGVAVEVVSETSAVMQ